MSARTPVPWLLLLLGCADGEDKSSDGRSASGEGTSPALAFPDGVVIDPKLDGASLRIVDTGCGGALTRTLSGTGGQARTLATEVWDGTGDDGVAFDPGPVTLVAGCDGAEVAPLEVVLHVVRLGVDTVDFVDGATGAAVPLAFHKRSVVHPEVVPVEGPEYRAAPAEALSPLDDDAGMPRAAVPPWADAMVAPWGTGEPEDRALNAPAAYVAGADVRVDVRGAATAIGRSGVPVDAVDASAPALRVVVDVATAPWRPGGVTTLDLAAVDATLGRETRALTWRWEAEEGDTWTPIPGSFTTSHTLWRTAGPAALRDGTALDFAPPVTWVGVLAETEDALTGVAPEPAAVLDALRDHVHDSDWILYDPSDTSYSSFEGPYIYWEYAWSDLTGWLDRDEGIRLYCHSVSCLLSTLAGHVGVDAPQQVLGVGFTTHLVRSAGATTWQAWGFNSHSVVSPDGGATLWDASIAMDGDGDPGHEPVTELAPKGLSFEEYTTLLSADSVEIVNSGGCYFQ